MSKIQLQDYVKYGKLFDVYGKLLSEDRQKVVSLYFEYNMTLAEIAREKQISRQAVLDSIEKSCAKLEEFENVLHIVEKENQITQILEEIKVLAKQQPEIVKKVAEILRKM